MNQSVHVSWRAWACNAKFVSWGHQFRPGLFSTKQTRASASTCIPPTLWLLGQIAHSVSWRTLLRHNFKINLYINTRVCRIVRAWTSAHCLWFQTHSDVSFLKDSHFVYCNTQLSVDVAQMVQWQCYRLDKWGTVVQYKTTFSMTKHPDRLLDPPRLLPVILLLFRYHGYPAYDVPFVTIVMRMRQTVSLSGHFKIVHYPSYRSTPNNPT